MVEPSGQHPDPVPRVRPTRLVLGDLDRVRVSAAQVPYLSVFAVLVDAVSGHRRGLPPALRALVQAAVGEVGRQAFGAVGGPENRFFLPEFMLPVDPSTSATMGEVLQALEGISAETMVAQIVAEFGADIPTSWRPMVENPESWRASFLATVTKAATVLRPIWRLARPDLTREIDRVQQAAGVGQLATLLNTLTPKVRYADHTLTFGMDWDLGDIQLGSRELVLVPAIAGPAMLMTNIDDDEPTVSIGYPVLDLNTHPGAGKGSASPLEILLGPQRSLVLRYLHRPSSMAEVARLLRTTPANATFHCAQLEAAELVARSRHGRQILVERTGAGSELISLLDRTKRPSGVE